MTDDLTPEELREIAAFERRARVAGVLPYDDAHQRVVDQMVTAIEQNAGRVVAVDFNLESQVLRVQVEIQAPASFTVYEAARKGI